MALDTKSKIKIYQETVDDYIESQLEKFDIKSSYSVIYFVSTSPTFEFTIPSKYENKYPDEYYELCDRLEDYVIQNSNSILHFTYEDSRLSGSEWIYELKSAKKGSIIIKDYEEYASIIAVTKIENCEDLERRIAKIYCFNEHDCLNTYLGTIPSSIYVGFTASHRFLVWILNNLFEKQSVWSALEEKHPNAYDKDYEFPKIDDLINSVKGGGLKRMTFDKRKINQLKYNYLEENYSYESDELSCDDEEESLSYSDKSIKEKVLLRYLKEILE